MGVLKVGGVQGKEINREEIIEDTREKRQVGASEGFWPARRLPTQSAWEFKRGMCKEEEEGVIRMRIRRVESGK